MKNKILILCVMIFLGLMGILAYVEFGLSTPKVSAEQDLPAATDESTGTKEAGSTAENEIRGILDKYYEIARTNDREALIKYSREIVAPEYRYTSELGTMDKQETFRWLESINKEFVSAEFNDLQVQVFGDTAIAKYTDVSKVRISGEAMRTPVRFTNVWMKRDGNWCVVAEHSSALKPPKLLPRHPLADNVAQKK